MLADSRLRRRTEAGKAVGMVSAKWSRAAEVKLSPILVQQH